MPFFSRGRAKLSRLHVNSFGAGGGPLPPPIPPNGLVFYDFKQSDLTKAITEIVRGEQVLQTTRAADLNVVQSSSPSIISYGANTAGFDVGVGMLVEKDSRNYLPVSVPGFGWNKKDAITLTENATTAPDGTNNATLVENIKSATAGDFLFEVAPTNTFVNSEQIVVSTWVKANGNAGDTVLFYTKRAGGGTGVNSPLRTITLTDEWQEIKDVTVQLLPDNNSAGAFFQSNNSTNADSMYVSYTDLEIGTKSTSPMYSFGVSSSRDATISEISTVLEAGYLVDDPSTATVPCVVANRSDGSDWLNGVNLSANAISFTTASTGGVNGKYFTQATLSWLGTLITGSNGTKIRILTNSGTNTLLYELENNPTNLSDNEAIQNGFENDGAGSNPLIVDFKPSDYLANFATGVAAIEQLRIAAGDDLSGFDTPSQWPVNDFITSFDVLIVQKQISGTTNPTIYECTTLNAGIVISLTDVPNDQVKIEKRVGGSIEAQLSVTLDGPIVDGDLLSVSFTQSPTDGFTFTVNGVSATDAAALSDIAIGSVARLSSMPPSNNVMPTKWQDFAIQSPIPPPPPVISDLIVDDISTLIGVTGASGFAPADFFGDDPVGSLSPGQSIEGKNIIAIYSNETGGEGKITFLIPDDSFDSPKVVIASFNGQSFTFLPDVFGSPSVDNVIAQDDNLFNLLALNQGSPIQFEIVSVDDYAPADFSSNGDFTNNGDFA